MKLSVALVSFSFPEFIARLARALSSTADVELLMPGSQIEPHRELAGPDAEIHALSAPRLRNVGGQAALSLGLVRHLRRRRFDVVHLQQGHVWFNQVLPLVPRPLVVTVHDASHHPGDRLSAATPQWVFDRGFRQADRLIAQSEHVASELRSRSFAQSRIDVVPLPVVGPDTATPPPAEPHTVLFFGRIWAYKGLQHLIRAEPIVSERVGDVRFIIAGTGEDFGQYERLMVNPERFEVHNSYVSAALRDELFERASVVVLPYLEASQTGVVPLAYAHGRPVVASAVGGLPEAVDHGVTGLLVPPADEHALGGAIADLLCDDRRRAAMGAAGRAKLDREWGDEALAAATMAVYEKALR